MRKRIVMALVLVILLGLAGCQTVKGFGRDMKGVGNYIDTNIVDDKD